MARTAEFEFVEYRKEEMIHASTQLIHNYARYSDLQGTGQWTRVLLNLAAIIRNSRTEGIKWATPGLNITFSGIPQNTPGLEDGRIIYSADEPHFILDQNVPVPVRPVLRTHIERVTEAIVDEMRDVYKLEPRKKDSLLYLNFPRRLYAERVEVVRAEIIVAPSPKP